MPHKHIPAGTTYNAIEGCHVICFWCVKVHLASDWNLKKRWKSLCGTSNWNSTFTCELEVWAEKWHKSDGKSLPI